MDIAASCKHVGVAEVIVAVLQRLSRTHVLCYTEVWGAEIGPAATGPAGPAGPAPRALIMVLIVKLNIPMFAVLA